MAAVLACGPEGGLSGPAAAFLFAIVKGPPPPPEVSAPVWRRVPGVITHRVQGFDPRDLTIHRGIPATNIPRTLVDLAATLGLDDLARACHEAEVRHRVSATAIGAAAARRGNRPGLWKLREIFDGDHRLTLSVLEERFLGVLDSAALPLPVTNIPLDGGYVDCRWPDRRLTVELDSYRFHHSRHAWEEDRRRERVARARGDEFRRYTYGDVVEEPAGMLAELRALIQ